MKTGIARQDLMLAACKEGLQYVYMNVLLVQTDRIKELGSGGGSDLIASAQGARLGALLNDEEHVRVAHVRMNVYGYILARVREQIVYTVDKRL